MKEKRKLENFRKRQKLSRPFCSFLFAPHTCGNIYIDPHANVSIYSFFHFCSASVIFFLFSSFSLSPEILLVVESFFFFAQPFVCSSSSLQWPEKRRSGGESARRGSWPCRIFYLLFPLFSILAVILLDASFLRFFSLSFSAPLAFSSMLHLVPSWQARVCVFQPNRENFIPRRQWRLEIKPFWDIYEWISAVNARTAFFLLLPLALLPPAFSPRRTKKYPWRITREAVRLSLFLQSSICKQYICHILHPGPLEGSFIPTLLLVAAWM